MSTATEPKNAETAGTVRLAKVVQGPQSVPIPDRTLPQIYRERALARGDQVAHRFKKEGAWQSMSWRALVERTDVIARALVSLGVGVGESVAILSASRAEWVQCDMGTMTAAAITIPIYPSSTPQQVSYILKDSASKVVFCENAEQLAKVLEVRGEVGGGLAHAVLYDGRPPAGGDGFVLAFDDFLARAASTPASVVDERLAARKATDLATIVYTSGTTGTPKGVVQTHRNHLSMVVNLSTDVPMGAEDTDLLFLPLAHSFARCESFAHLYIGFTVWFAEAIDKVKENLQEARPTVLFSVPRIYEKFYGKVLERRASLPPKKQRLFDWAFDVGRAVSQRKQSKRGVGPWLGLKYLVARILILRKIRDLMGGQVRFCISGGAALAKTIAEFFHAAGIPILEGYGLTETCPAVAVNRVDDFKFGTVGKTIGGVEIAIAEDGEILARGPNVVAGYYRRDEDTRASFKEGGWFATGDIGEFDAEGFLRITDRKKDLFKTSGGKYIAPQYLEGLLKLQPYISNAMIVGESRKFVSAVVAHNPETVAAWAKQKGLPATSYADLARHPEVVKLVDACVAKVNDGLASYEQIKRFVPARQDFTPQTGELTPTMKVRRKVVLEMYAQEIEALYAEPAPGA